MGQSDHAADDSELLLTRVFDAPRELVWEAWTQPEQIAQWWGPRGFTTTVVEMDLRIGGRWRYVMRDGEGKEYPASGIFLEVSRPERIKTTDEFDPGFEEVMGIALPRGIVHTAIFEELPGNASKTRLMLRIAHATPEDRERHQQMGVVEGWNSSFDGLEEHLTRLQSFSRNNGGHHNA